MSSRRKAWRRRDWLRRYLIWPLEAAGFVMVLALLATLPRRAAAEVGGTLAAWGSRFSYQHARALRRNLSVAFPHLSPAASADLQREIWRHFGRVLSTYSHLPPVLRRPDRAGGAVEVEGVEHLSAAAREGRFILAGAHFGHWELAGCYAAMAGNKFSGLYTPESNPWIDRIIRHLRQKASAHSTLIARGPNAVRRMMEVLRDGGGLFIIVDQRVDDGEWLPFFGHPAQTTTTPARLARRFRCPIVPGRAILLPDGRYRITYYEPLRPDLERDADADVISITTRLNQLFESWIREAPGQWLCLKRRWPKENRGPAATTTGSGIEAQSPKIPAPAD
jgi:KDO2-lipid IV(A) lauroyltransferase